MLFAHAQPGESPTSSTACAPRGAANPRNHSEPQFAAGPQVFQRGGSGALWDDPLPSGSASPVVAPNQSVVERLVSPVVKRSWSNGDIQHELGSGNNFRSVEGNYLRDPIFIDTSIHIAIIQYIDPCINMLGLVVGRPLASLSQPPSSCQRYPIFSDIQSSAHFHAP